MEKCIKNIKIWKKDIYMKVWIYEVLKANHINNKTYKAKL